LVKGKINIAVSGGSTPVMLFSLLAEENKFKVQWSGVNFYWADERCVRPDDAQSNFGSANNTLFRNTNIPKENIHRIFGENEPDEEAVRYSAVLRKNIAQVNNLPQFDLILLGTGEDGHTASIFPDQMELLTSEKNCAVAVHPESNQNRITLTGKVISNAERIYFLVTGNSKARVIESILNKKGDYLKYPAAHIHPDNGVLKWYLDKEAAEFTVNS